MVGGLLADTFYGIDLMKNPEALAKLEDPNVVAAMKILQIFTTGLGMFLIPAIVAASLFSQRPFHYLLLDKLPTIAVAGLTILMMFVAVPFINWMLVINQKMQLPEYLSGVEKWMKESEANAALLTEVFLKMDSVPSLIYNLFIVALLPALGEEFLFRGILQRLFREITGNVHMAILLTAILFSAIHMQFFGFFPRMMLGMLFGYLLYWSGSLWVPVLAHLINNGAAVLFAYFAGKQALPFNQETVGTENGEWPLVILSMLLIVGIIFLIKKISENKSDIYSDVDAIAE